MDFDLHAQAEELLGKIANSVYDRNPDELVIFTIKEIHAVENFLCEFSRELLANAGEY